MCMAETTTVSGQSIPDAQGGRVGEHVHQLLHLARALIHATTTDNPARADVDAEPVGSGGGETSRAVLLEAPFGMDLSGLSDQECVGWAQDLERLAHFQQALAVQVASEMTHRTVAGRYSALGVRGPVDMLTQSLKISASEASRRIALADAVFPSPDVIRGTLTPAPQPVLGDAFFTGQFGTEQAVIVSKFVAEAGHLLADGRITAEEHDEVETSLVESAATEDPDFLRRIGNRIMTLLDPDGQKPGPAELRAKQGITFRKARRGLVGFSGHLTIEQYEIMMTTIARFANPNHHKNINPTNAGASTMGDGSDGMVSESSFFTTAIDPVTGTSSLVSGETLGRLWADGSQDLTNQPTNGNGNGGAGNGNIAGVGGGTFSFINTPVPEPDMAAQPPVGGSGLGVGRAGQKNSSPAVPDSSAGSGWAGWEAIWDDSGPLIPLPPDENASPGAATTATTAADPYGGVGNLSPEGVWIPAPGSGEMLEGLDPIDPNSTDRVVADERSYPQKLLDGIMDCLQLAARTGELPLNGGLKAQLIITTSQEDLERRDGRGTAFTVHSGPVPLSLFAQSLCDPEITRLTYGVGQEIFSVGRAERLFTPPQRKILLARDLGCCFPDCTALAVWCEAHHIIPWQDGGETNIDNAALLCSRHHSLLHHTDWSVQLLQGTPFFTAPYLLDPSETLRRNTFHHGLPRPNYPTLRGQGWN